MSPAATPRQAATGPPEARTVLRNSTEAAGALGRAAGATAGLLLWLSPPTVVPLVDRDAVARMVVAGFGANLLFVAVWPGRWRWM